MGVDQLVTGGDVDDPIVDSLNTKQITNGPIYAGNQDGADADTRLANAISSANEGDKIILEQVEYTDNYTFSKSVTLQGNATVTAQENPAFAGDLTINEQSFSIVGVTLDGSSVDANNRFFSFVLGTVGGSSSITIGGDDARFCFNVNFGSVEFEAGTSRGIGYPNTGSQTPTDNGSNDIGT